MYLLIQSRRVKLENKELPKRTILWTEQRFNKAADAAEFKPAVRALIKAVIVDGETQEAACVSFKKSRTWLTRNLNYLRKVDKEGAPIDWEQYTVCLPKHMLPELQALEKKANLEKGIL